MRYEDFLPVAVPPDTINDWSRHSGADRIRRHTIPFKERKYYEDDCMVCYKAKLANSNDPLGEWLDRVVGTPEHKYCRPKPFAKCQPPPPPPPDDKEFPTGKCIPNWVRSLPPGSYYFVLNVSHSCVRAERWYNGNIDIQIERVETTTYSNPSSNTQRQGILTRTYKEDVSGTGVYSSFYNNPSLDKRTNEILQGNKPTVFQEIRFGSSQRPIMIAVSGGAIVYTDVETLELYMDYSGGQLGIASQSPPNTGSNPSFYTRFFSSSVGGTVTIEWFKWIGVGEVYTPEGIPLHEGKEPCNPRGKTPNPWKPPEQPRSPITIYKDDDMCCEDTIYYLENIARAMQNLSKSQEKISLLVDRAYVNLNKVSDNLNKLSERVEKLEKEKIDKIKDKIGDPIDIEIIDSELDKQGGQIRSVKPSTLFELGGLATNRTEIANSVIGVAQFPIPYDKEELKKAVAAINSSGTVEEIVEVLKPFNLPLIDNAGIDQFLFGLLPQDWQDRYKQAEDAVKGVYNAGFNLFKNKAGELVSKQIEQLEAKEKITSIAELLVKIYDSNSDGTLTKTEILRGSGGEDNEKEGDGFPIILPAEQIPGDNDVSLEDVPQALQSLCIGLLNHFQVSAYSFDMLLKLLIDTSEIKGVLYQNRATIKDIQNYLGYGTKEEALEIEQQINLSLKKDIEKSANNQEDLSAMKEFDGDKNFDKFLEKSKVFTTYHKWTGEQSLDARLDTIEATLSQGRAIADTPAI